jgi:uncharacterized protein (TIGR02246 family)
MDIVAIGDRWIAGWSSPDSDAFARLYALDGRYTDVAFGITRSGRNYVRRHHMHWRNAVPDFVMTRETVRAAANAVIVQAHCTGTFSGDDLVGGLLKATHKPFRCRTIAVLDLNEHHEIEWCTEYYDRSVMPGGASTPYNEAEEAA